MTALDHLRALIASGCDSPKGMDDEPCCFYCNGDWIEPAYIHAPDCPWVAAKKHVDRQDKKDARVAESKAWLDDCRKHKQGAAPFPGIVRATEEEAKMDVAIWGNGYYVKPAPIAEPHGDTRGHVSSATDGQPSKLGIFTVNRRTGEIMSRSFTLIEILIVLVIILIVSAVAMPTVLSSLSHRQVSEAARLLQAQLAGARDAAIRDNQPTGLRFLPDPAFNSFDPTTGKLDPTKPLAYNRVIPITAAPNYSEGMILPWQGPGLPPSVGALPYPGPGTASLPNPTYANTTALMIYEAPIGAHSGPTSWFWNIRVGDKIQLNGAGPWYTIIGPMVVPPQGVTIGGSFYANPELFVNVGPPGTVSPFIGTNGLPYDFLLVVNGRDDNQNGLVDEGWDGVDNDGVNGIDDINEWFETEKWLGAFGG